MKPWHVLNLVESGRALAFNRLPGHAAQAPFLSVQDLHSQYGLFQASTRLSLSRDLYDLDLPKSPLTLDKELVYVGRSSLNIHTGVALRPGGGARPPVLLATCEVQSVLVDRETRRPAQHPQWWRERYGAFSQPGRQLVVSVRPEPPAADSSAAVGSAPPSEPAAAAAHAQQDLPFPPDGGVWSWSLRVCDSDSDAYGHANWSVFLKYCLDALAMGAGSHDPRAAQRIKSRALKRADIAYVSEGSIGQDLRVKFWKDPVIRGSVHFSTQDSTTGKTINYAFLQFYPLEDVTLSISNL